MWPTIDRRPLIIGAAKKGVVEAVREASRRRKVVVMACNAMPDHVQLLVRIGPIDLGKFVGEVDGASARRFNLEFEGVHEIKWQRGDGIVSIRVSDTARVIRYIENQEAIHAARDSGASELRECTELPDVIEPEIAPINGQPHL